MAEILGLGLTHSPSFIRPDEDGESSLKRTLRTNHRVPAELKNPANWPEPMRAEYGNDEGYASAVRLRQRMVAGFRKLRAELDEFNPRFRRHLGRRPVRKLSRGHHPAVLRAGL